MSKLKIKVCGMKYPDNVVALCSISPDYIGYIFYPQSPRYVGSDPDPQIFSLVPEKVQKVGVFVNESVDHILEITKKFNISAVQLHGSESEAECLELKKKGKVVWKAIPGNSLVNQARIDQYIPVVDFFLFDTPALEHGGTGKKFNWTLLHKLNINKKFFLSGGLSLEDTRELKDYEAEGYFGVDVNSRFEIDYGKKDINRLKDFFKSIRDEE